MSTPPHVLTISQANSAVGGHPTKCAHIAQFYDEGAFPDRLITDFLRSALEAGESVVIIANANHLAQIEARLTEAEFPLARLEQNGRLSLLDAQATLDQFVVDGQVDRERFRACMLPVLDRAGAASATGSGRAFGEMVALLAGRGEHLAAIELENLWNEVLRGRSIQLWCAYPIQQFMRRASEEVFRHVCDEHDEIVPVLSWLDQAHGDGRWMALLQQQSFALQSEMKERQKAENELRASQMQLRALASHIESAREDERARLARDLHDELGQVLAVLKMSLTRWTRRLSQTDHSPAAAAVLAEAPEMLHLVDNAYQSTREMIGQLRSDVLETLGLVPALASQAQEFQKQTGIETHFAAGVSHVELGREQSLALYRITQESLRNVARHAHATRVDIELTRDPARLVLVISDNGQGFAPIKPMETGHWGMLGMRERALMLGGTCEVLGDAGRGTTLRVQIPLDAAPR